MDDPSTVTYFIQRGSSGPVKIGKTTNLQDRIKAIQTGCAEPVQLIGILDGDQEAKMHKHFSHLRMSGEWFRPSYHLLQYCSLFGKCFDIERQGRKVVEEFLNARDLWDRVILLTVTTEKQRSTRLELAITRLANAIDNEGYLGSCDRQCSKDLNAWMRQR